MLRAVGGPQRLLDEVVTKVIHQFNAGDRSLGRPKMLLEQSDFSKLPILEF